MKKLMMVSKFLFLVMLVRKPPYILARSKETIAQKCCDIPEWSIVTQRQHYKALCIDVEIVIEVHREIRWSALRKKVLPGCCETKCSAALQCLQSATDQIRN